MEPLLCRVILFSALFSAWCAAQQRTGDGRVILKLGYLASYGGNFIGSGKLAIRMQANGYPWAHNIFRIELPERPLRPIMYRTVMGLVYHLNYSLSECLCWTAKSELYSFCRACINCIIDQSKCSLLSLSLLAYGIESATKITVRWIRADGRPRLPISGVIFDLAVRDLRLAYLDWEMSTPRLPISLCVLSLANSFRVKDIAALFSCSRWLFKMYNTKANEGFRYKC